MHIQHLKFTLPMLAALSLSACGTVIDKSSQKIEFSAIGADEVWCYIDVNKTRYKAILPQTINVKRSFKDMEVDCYASGSRQISETIKPQVNETTVANAANLGAGLFYDLHTGASHKYPDKLVIDFTNSEIKQIDLPPYMAEEKYLPTSKGIEYMGPTETSVKTDSSQSKGFRDIIQENSGE